MCSLALHTLGDNAPILHLTVDTADVFLSGNPSNHPFRGWTVYTEFPSLPPWAMLLTNGVFDLFVTTDAGGGILTLRHRANPASKTVVRLDTRQAAKLRRDLETQARSKRCTFGRLLSTKIAPAGTNTELEATARRLTAPGSAIRLI